MKPTQQEIIELAREASGHTYPEWLYGVPMFALERLVHLALERFSAGGGEPVGIFREDDDIGHVDLIPHQQLLLKEGDKLYTHPSPTDLRAEYVRGLEDAAKVCDEVSLQANASWKMAYRPQDQGRETGADECADAIRALKGKQ